MLLFKTSLLLQLVQVRLPGRSHRTRCRQRLTTAAMFFSKLRCPGAESPRWAPTTTQQVNLPAWSPHCPRPFNAELMLNENLIWIWGCRENFSESFYVQKNSLCTPRSKSNLRWAHHQTKKRSSHPQKSYFLRKIWQRAKKFFNYPTKRAALINPALRTP